MLEQIAALAPAVARAAMDTGVATRPLDDLDAYEEQLKRFVIRSGTLMKPVFDAALAAITIEAARLIGVDDRVGSIERGKDADLALYDGNPFEYTSHCVGVIINGEVVSRETR